MRPEIHNKGTADTVHPGGDTAAHAAVSTNNDRPSDNNITVKQPHRPPDLLTV